MVKHTLASCSAILAALAIVGCSTPTHGSGGTGDDDAASAPSTPLGVFAPVRGAPAAFASVTGSAELAAQPHGGSDASISLRGLRPNSAYVGHVHTGTCDQPDPGGPHFKFDLDGPDAPPNEIHFAFTSNATGGASAQTHSARAIPDGAAGSIVVHQQQQPEKAGASPPAAAASSAHAAHGGSNAAEPDAGTEHSHAAKVACAALRAGARTATAVAPAAGGDAPLTIRVKADEPVGGVQELTVRKGDRVRFAVTADQAEDVHVHGYDLTRPVTPTRPAQLDFEARIEGIFEVELERAGVEILSLTVNPR